MDELLTDWDSTLQLCFWLPVQDDVVIFFKKQDYDIIRFNLIYFCVCVWVCALLSNIKAILVTAQHPVTTVVVQTLTAAVSHAGAWAHTGK